MKQQFSRHRTLGKEGLWLLHYMKKWDETYNRSSWLSADFLGHKGERTQTKLGGLPELRRQNWESKEAKEAKILRAEYHGEESRAERGREISGDPQIPLWVFTWLISARGWGNWDRGKNHQKGVERIISMAYRRHQPKGETPTNLCVG